MKVRLFVALLGAAGVAGCSDTSPEIPTARSYDHPVDVAFGCFGQMRLLGDDGVAQNTDAIVTSPQPLSACRIRALGSATAVDPRNPTAPGQEPIGEQQIKNEAMAWYVVAVQPDRGTIAAASTQLHGIADDEEAPYQAPPYSQPDFNLADADRLIPGHNGLAVGTTPVAIATDTAGCHFVTANAGSCDLSVIALDHLALKDAPIVSALPVTAGGQRLLARPAALAATDLASPVGVACPATPVGIHYVAYPDCHAVAAVDGATGAVVASIQFDGDGTATLHADGNLTCPRQCGAERDPLADGARPTSLDIVRDDRVGFQKLAIGLANRPVVTVVTLAATGLPTTVDQIDLDGDIGVNDVALSGQITMGGKRGLNDGEGTGAEAQFLYAVASDATVRVAEVSTTMRECDTQVDPRYLQGERDADRFICMPVGDVATPPRRPLARSPGIEFGGQARPVAVTIAATNNVLADGVPSDPDTLAGWFAYVALSTGFTTIINVDDDNYEDTVVASEPLNSQLPLALPHQTRDAGYQRTSTRDFKDPVTGVTKTVCSALSPTVEEGTPSNAVVVGGPHVDANPTRVINTASIANNKGFMLPALRASTCTSTDGTTTVVPDPGFAANLATRLATYPDWRAVPVEEQWDFVWEGLLSLDRTDGTQALDGPQIRTGAVDVGGGGISVVDPAAPFCAAGVEPRDIVTLRGCDASRGDTQCGIGETCYVHPDATVASGACLPKDHVDELAGLCRDYLVSQRRYAVLDSFAGRLTLRERNRELRTTPVDGCSSDQQCMDLARYDAQLASPAHPKDDTTAAPPFTYKCLADPFRTTAVNRCVMTCSSDDQCAAGTLCRAGRCIEGIVPPPQCVSGLQRYDLRASDAFVAIGSRTGYLHALVADAGGRCVKDPAASPLLIGRLPLAVPPCSGDGLTDLSPNPCRVTIDHTEVEPEYQPGSCELTTAGSKQVTRSTTGLRFRNPMMTVTLVDPTYPGDATCRGDRGGSQVGIPAVYQGYDLRFHVSDGFLTRVLGNAAVQPVNVVRAPDGAIWVVDAGDIVLSEPGIDNSASTSIDLRGQLIRTTPDSPDDAVHLQ